MLPPKRSHQVDQSQLGQVGVAKSLVRINYIYHSIPGITWSERRPTASLRSTSWCLSSLFTAVMSASGRPGVSHQRRGSEAPDHPKLAPSFGFGVKHQTNRSTSARLVGGLREDSWHPDFHELFQRLPFGKIEGGPLPIGCSLGGIPSGNQSTNIAKGLPWDVDAKPPSFKMNKSRRIRHKGFSVQIRRDCPGSDPMTAS